MAWLSRAAVATLLQNAACGRLLGSHPTQLASPASVVTSQGGSAADQQQAVAPARPFSPKCSRRSSPDAGVGDPPGQREGVRRAITPVMPMTGPGGLT